MGTVKALRRDTRMSRRSLTPRPLDPAPLVRAARGGDKAAFVRLHGAFVGAVRSVVLVRTPFGDVDDLVQDVFLAAWERLDELRDPAAFGGWILQIARHRVTDHLRRRRPASALPPEELPVPPSRLPEVREVLRALRSLSPAYSEPLAMRLIEGMSGPEIAARTGLTRGSVRVTLHRGMKQLRRVLEIDDD